MILYTKTFPLGKGISFSHYINILDEKNFPPFTLLITKIPKTKKVHIEIVFTNTAGLGIYLVGGFVGGQVLFNELTIEHSERGSFVLQASIGRWNLFLSLCYIVFSTFFLLFIFFAIVIFGMSLENVLFMLLIPAVTLYPLISTYLREIKFLDRIGSLGSDIG
jgi:hypothetical protein